jgi:rRNA-processing protein FCF1
MFTPQQVADTLRSITPKDLEETTQVYEKLIQFFDGEFKPFITEKEIDELDGLLLGYTDEIKAATIVRKLLKGV